MRFIEAEGVLTCPAWDGFVWQKHGFGTRHGVHPAALTLRQIHSAEVRIAGDFADRELQGDALISAEPGLTIGVRTADCVPVLLLDPKTRAVAAVHAGWRGTAASIVRNTIAKLQAEYGSAPADLQAAIGPCIRACCYEVSEDVAARFPPEHRLYAAGGLRPHLDLASANREQLRDAGIAENNIFDCGLCTRCLAGQFFSYRRDPDDPGRMLSFICRSV